MYTKVIREMIKAPDMSTWWKTHIKPEQHEKGAAAMKKWLSIEPNVISSIACGDWLYGKGYTRLGYKVFGVQIAPSKQVELYNFFNRPVVVTEQYAFMDSVIIKETNALNVSTYGIVK